MLYFLLIAVLIANGGFAQVSDMDSCHSGQLQVCIDRIPRTQIGLPRTRSELDAHCVAYHTGMTCMDDWIKRCLPTDGQKLIQRQIGGAKALMHYLCTNDSSLRRDFLKEQTCWARISPDWSQCNDELQIAARDISERTNLLPYFNKNSELCCARDSFVQCVADVGQSCSRNASYLLRRMASVLAADIAVCSPQPRAFCSAPEQYTASVLTLISGALLYPPRL